MLHSSHQMGPIDQSLQAIRNFFKAFVIIGKSGWRWLYFLPFIVYLILLFSGLYLTSDLHKHAMSLLEENVLNYEGDNTFYNILFSASSILTWIIIKIGLFILFGIFSASAKIILLSPTEFAISTKEICAFNFGAKALRPILQLAAILNATTRKYQSSTNTFE